MRPLLLALLLTLAATSGCLPEPRYEIVSGGPGAGHVVFRVDQSNGEVCGFRFWTHPNAGDPHGLALVGCSGDAEDPLGSMVAKEAVPEGARP